MWFNWVLGSLLALGALGGGLLWLLMSRDVVVWARLRAVGRPTVCTVVDCARGRRRGAAQPR